MNRSSEVPTLILHRSWAARCALAVALAVLGGMGSLVGLTLGSAAASPVVAAAYVPGLGTGPGYCAGARKGGMTLSGSPSIDDVYPCRPLPISNGDVGPPIPTFWPEGGDSGGFQCTEYAQRYLYTVTHGDLANFDNLSGEGFAGTAAKQFHFTLTASTSGLLPAVGDIISEAHSQRDPTFNVGDVAVVTAVGARRITILGENDVNGYAYITMNGKTNWVINPGSRSYQYTYFEWINPAEHGPAIPPGSSVAVLTQLKPAFQVRPSVISYTGDGSGLIGGVDGTDIEHPGHLHWPTYTQQQGVGLGLLWLDDCTPNCAAGTFRSTPVTVHVFAPSAGRFQRLTLTYTYRGRHYTDRRGIRYSPGTGGSPGTWQYYIIGL